MHMIVKIIAATELYGAMQLEMINKAVAKITFFYIIINSLYNQFSIMIDLSLAYSCKLAV